MITISFVSFHLNLIPMHASYHMMTSMTSEASAMHTMSHILF